MPYPSLSADEIERRQTSAGPGAVAALTLRQRRRRKGIPASQFAADVGLSAKHYRNIESALKQPSPEALARIADHLGCEPADLIVGQVAA